MIAPEDLPGTKLVRPGSRVRHRVLFRLPAGTERRPVSDALAARLPDTAVRITRTRRPSRACAASGTS